MPPLFCISVLITPGLLLKKIKVKKMKLHWPSKGTTKEPKMTIYVPRSFFVAQLQQGRNEVHFFVTHPILLPKMLIPGPKNDENLDPWTRFLLLAWSLVSRKTLLIPIPRVCDSRSRGCDPWSRPFLSLWCLSLYTSLRLCHKLIIYSQT